MDSKAYVKLVASLKEDFASRPEFSRRFEEWLNEKDRLLVDEMAKASGGVMNIQAMEFQAGRASMRRDIKQTFLPREVSHG